MPESTTATKEYLATSKNGRVVYIDYGNTNVTFHIRETSNLLELVKEVIKQADILGEKVVFETDMGRVVGTTTLVETTGRDEIIYAKRKERNVYSRFVKHREAVPSQYIVVALNFIAGEYFLWTAWCGRLLPGDYYDPSDRLKSDGFYQTHAQVYDESLIQLNTVRIDDPELF